MRKTLFLLVGWALVFAHLHGCAASQSAHRKQSIVAALPEDETADIERGDSAPREPSKVRLGAKGTSSQTGSGALRMDTITEQTRTARGLYFTGPFVRRFGVEGVIRGVRRARLNAAVIDLKDDRGRVTYDSHISILEEQEKHLLGDAKKLVSALKAAGIYTIGRIVCFNDNQLARREPARAILDGRPHRKNQPWISWGTATTWLDPYNKDNHALIVALAEEAQALGFDEVQLDYIRFPVDRATAHAHYPAQSSALRRYVLLGLLKQVDEVLRIPLGVDVFGLTAFRVGDPAGLGQSLEDWTAHVDVFSPMLYLNSMKSWGHREGEEQRAYRLILAGVQTLRKRVGKNVVIRPFLQAFRNGADHYDGKFIREQILGAKLGGGDGFLFWHPGSSYGMVQRALQGHSDQKELALK